MGWRNLIISSNAKLSFSQNQLVINSDVEKIIPLEDINAIVIENQQTNLTTYLMNKIAKENIVLYICDEKYLPSGVYIPFNNHSRQAKMVKNQINASNLFLEKCWEQIVFQKIHNQAKCLEILGIEGTKELEKIKDEITLGDKTNREAIAAKKYFKFMFKDFIRGEDNAINAALNYGYTILRGAIARTISAYGFIVSLGIHHKNELNAFNLADDLIEPFRATVDLWVGKNMIGKEEFSKQDKLELINLLNCDCIIKNEKHTIVHAVDLMVSSLVSAYNNEDYKILLLPEIIPLGLHDYE